MSEHIVDARGLSCPQPVIMTDAAAKKYKGEDIKVLVDETYCLTNVQKYLKSKKIDYDAKENDKDYEISFKA